MEVRVETPEDSLVSHDKDILLPFQFHDHRFQSNNDVSVRFPSTIPVVKLVVIPIGKVLGVSKLRDTVSA